MTTTADFNRTKKLVKVDVNTLKFIGVDVKMTTKTSTQEIIVTVSNVDDSLWATIQNNIKCGEFTEATYIRK